jgi:hypothetical protein
MVTFVPDAKEVAHPNRPASPESVAVYIAALAGELGQLAKTNGFDALGYILDMARLEAEEVSKSTSETEPWAGLAKSRRAS